MITKDKWTICKMAVSAATIAGLIWFASMLLGGCATTNTTENGIPQFRWLDKEWGICAGGQPTTAGWYWLSVQSAGTSGQRPEKIAHVIKLNTEEEGSDSVAELQLHMLVDRVPISTLEQLDPQDSVAKPMAEKIRQALHLVRPGTFIHDTEGKDSVGAFVYGYRRDRGWTGAQAREELSTNGFHSVLMGLNRFVDEYQPVPAMPYSIKKLSAPKEK